MELPQKLLETKSWWPSPFTSVMTTNVGKGGVASAGAISKNGLGVEDVWDKSIECSLALVRSLVAEAATACQGKMSAALESAFGGMS